jgi:hypothetical protein
MSPKRKSAIMIEDLIDSDNTESDKPYFNGGEKENIVPSEVEEEPVIIPRFHYLMNDAPPRSRNDPFNFRSL